MKTAALSKAVDRYPYVHSKRRRALGHILMGQLKGASFSNVEKLRFSAFFFNLNQLTFRHNRDRKLFIRFLAHLCIHKEFNSIPVNYFWMNYIHEWMKGDSDLYLDDIFHYDYHTDGFKKKKVAPEDIWEVIGEILGMIFSDDCMELKSRRNTSALDARNRTTWSLFPFWLYKRFPRIYEQKSSQNKKIWHDALKHVSFEEVTMYAPVFVLRWFENFFGHPDNLKFVKYLVSGKNIRKATFLPFPLTKRMAHEFHDLFDVSSCMRIDESYVHRPLNLLAIPSSTYFLFDNPMVLSFVFGLGGNYVLAKEFSRIYSNVTQYDFQKSIVEFMVRNEVDGAENIRRVLGFINHMRHENGSSFSLKGRTLRSLTRDVEAYYVEQQRTNDINFMVSNGIMDAKWDGARYNNFEKEDEKVDYQLIQLKTAMELVEESRQMNHCVRSYHSKCQRGMCSIWSLRMLDKTKEEQEWKPVVTIEVDNKARVVQAKARFNYRPETEWLEIIRAWCSKEGLSIGHSY